MLTSRTRVPGRSRCLAYAIAAVVASGCESAVPPGGDAGIDATVDARVADAFSIDTMVTDAGPGLEDGGAPVLLSPTASAPFTVTTDGLVVFAAGAQFSAVSLAGGPPRPESIPMGTLLSAPSHRPTSRAVGIHTADGRLVVWSAATGVHTLATGLRWLGAWAVDEAGTRVAYGGSSDASGTGDFFVARVDGTRTTLLATGVVFSGVPACHPQPRFVGSTLLFLRCPAGGTTTLAAVDEGGGFVDLASDVVWLDVSRGRDVVVDDAAGTLSVVPITGGAPVVLARDVQTAMVSHGSDVLAFLTSGGELRSVRLDGTEPALLDVGVVRLLDITPAGDEVAYASALDAVRLEHDVRLAHTTLPADPLVVSPALETFFASFTPDGARLLFGGYGEPNATSLSAAARGAATTLITTSGDQNYLALASGRVVYEHAFSFGGISRSSHADLAVIDLASGRRASVAERVVSWMISTPEDRVVLATEDGRLFVHDL